MCPSPQSRAVASTMYSWQITHSSSRMYLTNTTDRPQQGVSQWRADHKQRQNVDLPYCVSGSVVGVYLLSDVLLGGVCEHAARDGVVLIRTQQLIQDLINHKDTVTHNHTELRHGSLPPPMLPCPWTKLPRLIPLSA